MSSPGRTGFVAVVGRRRCLGWKRRRSSRDWLGCRRRCDRSGRRRRRLTGATGAVVIAIVGSAVAVSFGSAVAAPTRPTAPRDASGHAVRQPALRSRNVAQERRAGTSSGGCAFGEGHEGEKSFGMSSGIALRRAAIALDVSTDSRVALSPFGLVVTNDMTPVAVPCLEVEWHIVGRFAPRLPNFRLRRVETHLRRVRRTDGPSGGCVTMCSK